ncbi:MAG: hypothetical protein IH886_11995 [Nitrospinae bacterium]|nr:hypothetical protein [Nitrospinota bacterium]
MAQILPFFLSFLQPNFWLKELSIIVLFETDLPLCLIVIPVKQWFGLNPLLAKAADDQPFAKWLQIIFWERQFRPIET